MRSVSTIFSNFSQPMRVLVTGASRGIGRAMVHALLGVPSLNRVFITSRHATGDRRIAELASKSGGRLHAFDMDVTLEASISAAVAAVSAETEQLDLIINCAGLLHDGAQLQPEKRLADVTPASLHRCFAVNTVGPLLVAKHFQALLPRRNRAVFASLSARVGSIGDNRLGGWYSYRTSKAAQNMVTKNLSIELRRRATGIICVGLHPGTVDTGLSRPFQGNVSGDRLFSAERAAQQLLTVIDGLEPTDNGEFFAWNAQNIPW